VGHSISVESSNYKEIFHPYHLTYTFLLFLFYKILNVFSIFPAILTGQILSMVFAAYSIYLFGTIVKSLIKDEFLSVLSVFTFTFSYWFWYYSMDAELHIPNMFFTLLAIKFFIDYYKNPTAKKLIFCAAINSFLVIFHQMNLLIFGLSFLFCYDYYSEKRKAFFIWAVSFAVITVCPYVLIPKYIFGITDFNGLLEWLTRYQSKGYWSNITDNYFLDSLKGFSFALTGGGKFKLIINSAMVISMILYYINKMLIRKIDRIELYIFSVFIFYAGIVIYWHPSNPENWWAIVSFNILFYKMAEAVKYNSKIATGINLGSKNAKSVLWILIGICFTLIIFGFKLLASRILKLFLIIWAIYSFNAVLNGYIIKYHDKEKNPSFKIISRINNIYADGDFVIGLGEGYLGNLNVYLKYFTKINYSTMAIELDLNSGSIEKTFNSIEKKVKESSGKVILLPDLTDSDGVIQLSKMHRVPGLKNSIDSFIEKIGKEKIVLNY